MFDKEQHVGHILFDSLKSMPDSICQIDASTGEEETNASVLSRSLQLARCLRRLGLVPGDPLVLSGRNHLDLAIPNNAAMFLGLPITGIDPTYKTDEVKSIFKVVEPKIAFCEPASYQDYIEAAKDLKLSTKVFTFGHGEHSMQELIATYDTPAPAEEFEIATLDPAKAYLWLVTSGGTTGVIKVAAMSHNSVKYKIQAILFAILGTGDRKEQPYQPALHLSSIQWMSSLFNLAAMSLIHQTRVQTSAPLTTDHVIDIINKYKPVSAMFSPSLASDILNSAKPCDLTCFRTLALGGGKVFDNVLLGLRGRVNSTTPVMDAYGQTENLGLVFIPNPQGPVGNCGKPFPGLPVKLVNPDTEEEITEPNVTGELWTKGVGFTCYYRNPEETAAAFSKDGWFKTGDLMYRDEDNNYYFVERIKMLIKYRNYHIFPTELEAVIRNHEAVADVCVTSVPDVRDGEHPVACVVTRGAVTAREIEELVASKLSDSKHLRGGVFFLDELPVTHAGKVARGKLRQLVQKMLRE